MKRIAIIGTQGVPAHYGGFETLAENLIGYCSPDIVYTVFCSSKGLPTHFKTYKGARLRYVPLQSNGIQSILYDIVSMLCALSGYDVILILGVSGGIFIPLLKALTCARILVNTDGLEYRRAKWGWLPRLFLHMSEQAAVCFAHVVIADNIGIAEYVRTRYRRTPALIAYGGDHAIVEVSETVQTAILKQLNLSRRRYGLSICRIEPENNLDMVLEAFAETGETVVIVGNWEVGAFARSLKRQYKDYPNIRLLDAVYDIELLYVLRTNMSYYVHGHAAGGTNPSLVEAMFFGRPILAYQVIYNRATTANSACYFRNSEELCRLLRQATSLQQEEEELKRIACERFRWDIIAREYEALYE
ncbi:MAG: DUF1972 domain-containing protein [Prevotellaceae bacterium]|jgi:glycosyltransferase involved in cell wall biosynthesis|nr:DUF1972 domain-containing protein [Prevotellaceae bacterium]